jgi:hypothetical protein
MALANRITGAGQVISGSTEKGKYAENITKNDGTQWILTTYFDETRQEIKWYALSLAAIVAYKSENPDADINYSLTDQVTGAYEMTVVNVARNITGYSLLKANEKEDSD